MPMVSVITPAYNATLFLEETIRSVQAQTFTDWEMIIVDDCSQDDTYKLAKQFSDKDSRIRVFQNKINSGVAETRNKAIDVSNGEYIAFLDSDDLWLPQKLEKQIKYMKRNGFVFTYTNYQKFDSASGKCGKVVRAPEIMTSKKVLSNTAIGCLTVVVNRSIIGSFHMPSIPHTEDNVAWERILNKGYKGMLLDEVLAFYRVGNNNSLTSNKAGAAMGQWKTYRNYYEFSTIRSVWYFINYAYHAVIRHYVNTRRPGMEYENIYDVIGGGNPRIAILSEIIAFLSSLIIRTHSHGIEVAYVSQ